MLCQTHNRTKRKPIMTKATFAIDIQAHESSGQEHVLKIMLIYALIYAINMHQVMVWVHCFAFVKL